MAGLAQILKESGHEVSGSDNQFYPPMSDYIRNIGIKTFEGYSKKTFQKQICMLLEMLFQEVMKASRRY